MLTAPLFSIITVTYKAANTIQRTLQSVEQQTCHDYEHIVIDGASTDGTLDILDQCDNVRMSYISERDRGIYDAMNKGISMANGQYFIFLNAGDKFHSANTLQLIADTIKSNDSPGIVYGQTELVDDNGQYLGPRHLVAPPDLSLKSFKKGMVVCHQAMAVNHRVTVPYNLKYKYSADYEWVIICLQHSRKNVYIPHTLIDYLSEGTTTTNHRQSLKERFKIMCHYYGTIPTVINHIGFAFRYLKRRKKATNIQ